MRVPLTPEARAESLIEALPYIQRFRGQTFVIKYGGAAMEEDQIVDRFLRDVVFLEAVANSALVKCAWAGGDPNWGRIMCALGYSGARMIEEKTNIWYGDLPIVQQGVLASTPWAKLKAVAASEEFRVKIDLSIGELSHTVWTTDLTEEYVRFNLGE